MDKIFDVLQTAVDPQLLSLQRARMRLDVTRRASRAFTNKFARRRGSFFFVASVLPSLARPSGATKRWDGACGVETKRVSTARRQGHFAVG